MERFSRWYQDVNEDVIARAQKIKLLICDIDGVFSDGTVTLANSGDELKGFNTKDGYGLRALINSGVEVAVITGRNSKIVETRMTSLGVKHIYQGMDQKLEGYQQLKQDLNLVDQDIAYIGDDFPDAPVMLKVGLATATGDAHPYLKEIAHYTTLTLGGRGSVRELTDLIIMTQNGEEYITENITGASL